MYQKNFFSKNKYRKFFMKEIDLFSMLLTLILFLLTASLATASFAIEAGEISYQINNSDHIVIGIVSNIEAQDNTANNSITVDEWLYNPLPTNSIIVKTTSWAEDARFDKNESVLLMLNDKSPIPLSNESPEKGVFYMDFGELGKHPVSDRNAVIKELQVQGKWQEGNLTVNKTNETEPKSRLSANSNQDTPSKSVALDINDPNLQRVPLDFGPQTFKNLKNNTDVIAIRGQMPQFSTQEERENWGDKLDNIRELADNDLSPYAYPKGPVLAHGDGVNGCIEIDLYKGMNFTDNQIDEIYNVINKIGNKLNIQDVPVVFFKRDFVQDAILTEDSGAIDEKSNLSTSKANNGELNFSNNPDSISENSSSSNGSKSSVIRSSPGFELLGSLVCMCVGWKLRKM
jgi:hypothetical protein